MVWKRWLILLILILGMGAFILEQNYYSLSSMSLVDEFLVPYQTIALSFSLFTIGMIVGYFLLTLVTVFTGTRWGLTVGFAGIALAATVSALTGHFYILISARFLAGFFAAALIPAAIQTVREWFPVPLRPLAIGLILTSMGGFIFISSVLIDITEITIKRPFIIIPAMGAVAAAVLCAFFLKTPGVFENPKRLNTGGVISSIMLPCVLFLSALITVSVSSFLVSYLVMELGFSTASALKVSLFSSSGNIAGSLLIGGIACLLIYTVFRPPKTRALLMTICGFMLPFIALTGFVTNFYILISISTVAMFGIQGIMILLYSSVADTLPVRGVSIVMAIGGLALNVGNLIFSSLAGFIVYSIGFRWLYLIAGILGLVLWLLVAIPAWFIKQPEAEAEPTKL